MGTSHQRGWVESGESGRAESGTAERTRTVAGGHRVVERTHPRVHRANREPGAREISAGGAAAADQRSGHVNRADLHADAARSASFPQEPRRGRLSGTAARTKELGTERAANAHQQGRKSRPPASCWIELNSQRFDPVAKASELPDHSGSAHSLRPFVHGPAPFLVADPLMQNHPDQPTKPMGNRSDGLIVSQAWYEAAIHDLEDASFYPDRSVGALIENASHMAVALWGAVVLGYSRAFFISGACSHPRGQLLVRRKGRCRGADFGNNLLGRIHSQTGHFRQTLHCLVVLAE